MKLAALLLLLAGCSTWTTDRPAASDIRIHQVADLQGICNRIVGHWDIYLGCVWWNRQLSSCDVFVPKGAPQFVLAHELRHCAGEDHAL